MVQTIFKIMGTTWVRMMRMTSMSIDLLRWPVWRGLRLFCWALAFVGLMGFAGLAQAQLVSVDPDWKESEAPAPPAFDLKRLIPMDISRQSQLRWGVDPDTVKITPDGMVRYVLVAQSESGTVNAMYEGLRCATAEFKLYARHTPGAGWSVVQNPNWQSLREPGRSNHTSMVAKAGLCDGRAPPTSVREAVQRLRSGGRTHD
jgi:hypothetical protein